MKILQKTCFLLVMLLFLGFNTTQASETAPNKAQLEHTLTHFLELLQVLQERLILVSSPGYINNPMEEAIFTKYVRHLYYKGIYGSEYSISPTIENTFIYMDFSFDDETKTGWNEIVVSNSTMEKSVVLSRLKIEPDEPSLRLPSPSGRLLVKENNDWLRIMRVNNDELSLLTSITIPRRSTELRWSYDEKYLAAVFSTKEDDWQIAIYEVKTGKEIYFDQLTRVKKAEYLDPIRTVPSIAWQLTNNTLYTSDDSSIHQIKLKNNKFNKNVIPTSIPCHGLVVHKQVIYCHNELGTTFSAAKNHNSNSYVGKVYKYMISNGELSEPITVSEKIEGEYEARMYVLDDNHLLFVPNLGGTTIINTTTNLRYPTGYQLTGEKLSELFSVATGAIETGDRVKTVPLIYSGQIEI